MVIQIAFASSDPQLVLATVSRYECWAFSECNNPPTRGVIISRDGGDTWTQTGLSSGTVLALAVSPQDSSRIYAAVHPGEVHRSHDAGQTWDLVAQNLSAEIVLEMVYAAAHDSGVFVSQDGGQTWTTLNDGLLTRAAMDLALSADGADESVLYLATGGGGVLRLGTPPASPQQPTAPQPEVEPTQPPESPPVAEPTQPPAPSAPEAESSEGRGICGGVAVIPLALVGLVWINRRRR